MITFADKILQKLIVHNIVPRLRLGQIGFAVEQVIIIMMMMMMMMMMIIIIL